ATALAVLGHPCTFVLHFKPSRSLGARFCWAPSACSAPAVRARLPWFLGRSRSGSHQPGSVRLNRIEWRCASPTTYWVFLGFHSRGVRWVNEPFPGVILLAPESRLFAISSLPKTFAAARLNHMCA